jgi:hypothetical protein
MGVNRMKLLKRYLYFTFGLFFLFPVASETITVEEKLPLYKLDAWNRFQMQQIIEAGQGDSLFQMHDIVNCILQVKSFEKLRELTETDKIRLRAVAGEVVTAEIPLAQLPALLMNEGVAYIKFCERQHNTHLPINLINKRPVIGLIDTGIKLSYDDFSAEDGSSRLIVLWDQTEPGMAGPVLNGPTAGRLYVHEEIKEYFLNKKNQGHGSITGRLAAGNGPILLQEKLKTNFEKINLPVVLIETTQDEGDIIDALSFLKKQCRQWGVPCVVNLSIALHNGPHNDDALLAQVCNSLSADDFIIVAAAGNEGNDRMHVNLQVNKQSMLAFKIKKKSLKEETSASKGIVIYGWYKEDKKLNLELTSPSGSSYQIPYSRQSQEVDEVFGSVIMIKSLSGYPAGYTGSNREIQLVIQNDGQGSLPEGEWILKVSADSTSTIPINFWIVSQRGYYCQFLNSTNANTHSISDIASASQVLSVGGYEIEPGTMTCALAGGSSRCVREGQIIEPDILASFYVQLEKNEKMAGTSASAPLITHMIACLWEKYPQLSGNVIRNFFTQKIVLFDNANQVKENLSPFYRGITYQNVMEYFKMKFKFGIAE